MSINTQEQMNVDLLEEVKRLKRENQSLKERYRLATRKFDVVIGSVKEGKINFYFNDSNFWESQIPKEDGRGRYIEKGNEKFYIYPMSSDFKVYVFSEKQAEIIRESFRENGKGHGGYKNSISNDIACKNNLQKMNYDLSMKDIHETITDDEFLLLDLLIRDTGERGYEHEQIDRGNSLELIKAIQKVLSKTNM